MVPYIMEYYGPTEKHGVDLYPLKQRIVQPQGVTTPAERGPHREVPFSWRESTCLFALTLRYDCGCKEKCQQMLSVLLSVVPGREAGKKAGRMVFTISFIHVYNACLFPECASLLEQESVDLREHSQNISSIEQLNVTKGKKQGCLKMLQVLGKGANQGRAEGGGRTRSQERIPREAQDMRFCTQCGPNAVCAHVSVSAVGQVCRNPQETQSPAHCETRAFKCIS